MSNAWLVHHGIKGQKHGVRRWQNKDGSLTPEGYPHYGYKGPRKTSTQYIKKGGTVRKGDILYRIGADKGDPTALNRKYFSTNMDDHQKWANALVIQNMMVGNGASSLTYEASKDLKIASNREVGKAFIHYLEGLDDGALSTAYKDIEKAREHYPSKADPKSDKTEKYGDTATAVIAAQTKLGQEFINKLIKSGYDGAGDINGTDISEDPIIIFNPDVNTKLLDEEWYDRSYLFGP